MGKPSLILRIGNFYANIRPDAPGCKTAPEHSMTNAFPNPWPMLSHWKSSRKPTTDAFPSACDSSCLWNRTRTQRQMHFQVLAICRACGIAPEPTTQKHFQALAIGRACGIAPEPPRQMHFQFARHVVVLGIWGNAPEPFTTDTFSACAPRMPCVVLRVDDQKLHDRSISDMMCVWCQSYCRPGSASAVSPYCVLENT